jgi:signal transduction histidine kinase
MAERKKKGTRLTLREAEERIAELEAELAAAHKTISALLDKAERSETLSENAVAFEAAARMEQLVAKRTEEVEEQSRLYAQVNSELRALTKNLDQIVRARTRALAESEAQLREKMEELERQSELKAEFISIAAHELRTPLTSIVGYHDLFLEGRFGKLDDKMRRPMQSLQRNSHRLKRLVDEMLDISRIEAGKVKLYIHDCNLGEVVNHVVDELRPLAEAKEQSLTTELGDLAPIPADADKLHQVVTNLVSNAIRYTPEGGMIQVLTDLAPEEIYAGSWVRLRVRDNGVGIPLHLRARIFEPFSDVNTAKHHTSSGPDSAGLGLYIARGLVDLHGGLITVDSEEGAYTEFTVLLPQERPEKKPAKPAW